MDDENSKVALVAALNEETLVSLDNYVTLTGQVDPNIFETPNQRLNRITYQQILTYLK